jgi:hypothetical protein
MPHNVLAEQLALPHVADIEIVQRGLLGHAIIVQLDEAAEIGRDRSRIIDRQLINGEVVIVPEAGRGAAGLQRQGVGKGGLRSESQRQPVVLSVAGGIAVAGQVCYSTPLSPSHRRTRETKKRQNLFVLF